MSTYTIGADPSLNLDQLSDWIWGQETAFGPIIAIGNNGHSTAATFEWADTGPVTKAELRPYIAGQPAPAGLAMLCNGTVFITAQLIAIAAYR